MRYCWAPNCKETDDKITEVSFHLFPKIPYQRTLWITATGRFKEPGKTAVICSKHFKDDDFHRTTKRVKLKPGAVPSKFEITLKKEQEHLTDVPESVSSSSTSLLSLPLCIDDSDSKLHEDVKNILASPSSNQSSTVSQSQKKILYQPRHVKQVRLMHLSSLENRCKYWSQAMEEITKLRKKVKILQEEKRRLVKRVNNFKSMMRTGTQVASS